MSRLSNVSTCSYIGVGLFYWQMTKSELIKVNYRHNTTHARFILHHINYRQTTQIENNYLLRYNFSQHANTNSPLDIFADNTGRII